MNAKLLMYVLSTLKEYQVKRLVYHHLCKQYGEKSLWERLDDTLCDIGLIDNDGITGDGQAIVYAHYAKLSEAEAAEEEAEKAAKKEREA